MNDFEHEARVNGADWGVAVMTNGGLYEYNSSGGAGVTAGTVFGRIAGVSAARWACG